MVDLQLFPLESKLATMHRGFVHTPLGHIHWRATLTDPSKARTIVCLHMSPRSMDEYSDVAPFLAAAHRLVMIDFAGLGASDDWDFFGTSPPTIAQHGQIVLDNDHIIGDR